jgi:cell division protein FtsL
VRHRRFLVLWVMAVLASTAAFVVHLALRGKTVDLGYRLGLIRGEQAALRENKRVLELEAASYQTPERVEKVARTLLGMTPPPPERVIPLRPLRVNPPAAAAGSGAPAAPAAATATAAAPERAGAPPTKPASAAAVEGRP